MPHLLADKHPAKFRNEKRRVAQKKRNPEKQKKHDQAYVLIACVDPKKTKQRALYFEAKINLFTEITIPGFTKTKLVQIFVVIYIVGPPIFRNTTDYNQHL